MAGNLCWFSMCVVLLRLGWNPPSILDITHSIHHLYLIMQMLPVGVCRDPVCLFLTLRYLSTLLCEDIERSCMLYNVCCCFLKCKPYKVVVVSIYRSSSIDVSKCLEDLHSLLLQLFGSCKYVLLACDFNIDLLLVSSPQEKYNNLLNWFLTCSAYQRVDKGIIFFLYIHWSFIVLLGHFSVQCWSGHRSKWPSQSDCQFFILFHN